MRGVGDEPPDIVFSMVQDTGQGTQWAQQDAEREAIASSFWKAVSARLADTAPGTRVVEN